MASQLAHSGADCDAPSCPRRAAPHGHDSDGQAHAHEAPAPLPLALGKENSSLSRARTISAASDPDSYLSDDSGTTVPFDLSPMLDSPANHSERLAEPRDGSTMPIPSAYHDRPSSYKKELRDFLIANRFEVGYQRQMAHDLRAAAAADGTDGEIPELLVPDAFIESIYSISLSLSTLSIQPPVLSPSLIEHSKHKLISHFTESLDHLLNTAAAAADVDLDVARGILARVLAESAQHSADDADSDEAETDLGVDDQESCSVASTEGQPEAKRTAPPAPRDDLCPPPPSAPFIKFATPPDTKTTSLASGTNEPAFASTSTLGHSRSTAPTRSALDRKPELIDAQIKVAKQDLEEAMVRLRAPDAKPANRPTFPESKQPGSNVFTFPPEALHVPAKTATTTATPAPAPAPRSNDEPATAPLTTTPAPAPAPTPPSLFGPNFFSSAGPSQPTGRAAPLFGGAPTTTSLCGFAPELTRTAPSAFTSSRPAPSAILNAPAPPYPLAHARAPVTNQRVEVNVSSQGTWTVSFEYGPSGVKVNLGEQAVNGGTTNVGAQATP